VAPQLVDYWRHFGENLGVATTAAVPAPVAGGVRARAVDVRPEDVAGITAMDLNIVVERLDLPTGRRFNAIVATNVLVYYDAFLQGLAVRNMTAMLVAGGLLLTNQPVPLPEMSGLAPVVISAVDFDTTEGPSGPHRRGDSVYVYRKG
jgi:hypothetical protein